MVDSGVAGVDLLNKFFVFCLFCLPGCPFLLSQDDSGAVDLVHVSVARPVCQPEPQMKPVEEEEEDFYQASREFPGLIFCVVSCYS